MQILDLGFIFSFLCTGGILLATPWLEGFRRPPPGRLGPVRAKARTLAAVSLVAWLVSAPVTAMCFGRFSPAAVLCNLAIVPLAEASVTSSVLSLALSPFAPPLSILCNRAACLCAEGMASASTAAASFPGATWEIEPWGPGAVALWYAALVPLLIALRRKAASV